MASFEVVIVASSPPKQFRNYNMSSSPPLPSIDDLIKNRPQIAKNGSRVTPVPQYACSRFTTASSFLQSKTGKDSIQLFDLDIDKDEGFDRPKAPKPPKARVRKTKASVDEQNVPEKKPHEVGKKELQNEEDTPAKPRKSRAKKVEKAGSNDGLSGEPAPRKPRTKKVEQSVDGGAGKEKTVRKSRVKKVDDGTQTRIPNVKVNKASMEADSVSKGSSTLKKSALLSKSDDPFYDSIDFGLVEAVTRRANWTPPAPTAKNMLTTPAPIIDLDGSHASAEGKKGFRDLFGDYGFTKVDAPTQNNIKQEYGTRKRKLIELFKTNISTVSTVSPPKEKVPKKKARTITGLATSAYAEEDVERPAPLLQYFLLETAEKADDGFKIPAKKRSKSPKKPKKGSAQAPILLSPGSALKHAVNQDFVFGTSSQLARENSPTLLRDLQEAMQASNEADDPFADPIQEPELGSASEQTRSRNLWAASARDTGGKLLDVEVVDLADSPLLQRQEDMIPNPIVSHDGEANRLEEVEDWQDIDALGLSPAELQPSATLPESISPFEAAIRLDLLSSPVMRSPKPKISSNPAARTPNKAKLSDGPTTKKSKSAVPTMPDFSSYTTAQLTKEIATYRFKPVKSRNHMIALLEKCWEAKHRPALTDLGTNALVIAAEPSSIPSPPRKVTSHPRDTESNIPIRIQTPKKTGRKSTQVVDDISDSETQSIKIPRKSRTGHLGGSTLPLKFFGEMDGVNTSDLSPASSQKALFAHITSAIKATSPSKDVNNPSWHEKILLYDPIALEDLTVWLNTGGLQKVGWDGEVERMEVKAWCESRSICCVWKESLRGGPRSRY